MIVGTLHAMNSAELISIISLKKNWKQVNLILRNGGGCFAIARDISLKRQPRQ